MVPTTGALTVSIIGFGVLFLGGWLGGELVDRLGVGVHDGAHLNAPSSLSDESARGNAPMVDPANPLGLQ